MLVAKQIRRVLHVNKIIEFTKTNFIQINEKKRVQYGSTRLM